MLFSSYIFILAFLPISLLGFYTLRAMKCYSLAKVFLIGASVFFYGYFKVEYIFILIFSMLVNFSLAHFILKATGGGKQYLIIGIIFNLSLLGFFKYTDFFLENFNLFSNLLELDFNIPLPHILLPLALSFVTFQQIAFLIDCYKKVDISDMQEVKERCQSEKLDSQTSINFLDYALFICFFPQLIAGPIVHHKEMMPQFHSLFLHSLNAKVWEHCAKGLFIFSIGLFKKVFIADSFAKWANAGFNVVENGGVLNIAESWATSLSYTFQLYFDFSGYADMAIGLGLFFGIMLPLNFNSPYKSLNISEFWRRWHITLGRFLKEYVYIPLGGNKNTKYQHSRFYTTINQLLTLRNLFIVAFLSGIWHGAGYGFIIWGILHGSAMCIHRIYTWSIKSIRGKIEISLSKDKVNVKDNKASVSFNAASVISTHISHKYKLIFLHCLDTKVYKFLCWFITFNFINITWIFFRSENVSGAINLLKGMFGITWVELPLKAHHMPALLEHIGGRNDTIIYIILGFVVCVGMRNGVERLEGFRTNVFNAILAAVFLCYSLFVLGSNPYTEFIYFNF